MDDPLAEFFPAFEAEPNRTYTVRAGEWRVVFNNRVQSPRFNSAGAAQAFLDGLEAGTRKEEVSNA